MNRILVVEDEKSIADMIRLILSKNGYICDAANNGNTGAELIETRHYDLVLLDIMLPGINGYDLLEYIKQFDTPVIFVTAKTALAERVKGLKLGAEDYILKPFEPEELLARVETVLRRFNKTAHKITVGKIEVNTLSRAAYLSGMPVSLTAKEFELLLLLIRNQNIALYRETIYEQVWGEPWYGNTRTIDLHIQRLKKKLDLDEAIETVYKIGYKFVPEKLK